MIEMKPGFDDCDGVIFDMDGVVFDSMPLLLKTACDLLSDYGICLSDNVETLKKFAGLSTELFQDKIETTYNVSIDWRSFYIKWEKLILDQSGTLECVPGILDFVTTLHTSHKKIGLATSSRRKLVNAFFVSHRNLFSLFDVIICADDIRKSKPDPEIFLTAAECLEVPPNRCIVVEDSLNGLIAAKNAGMSSLAITTSFDEVELNMADIIISSFSEVL